MGHIKHSPSPASRRWWEVVGLIADRAAIAAATVRAGEKGLRAAANDPGVVEAFWLLVRLPLAARAPAFVPALRGLGGDVPGDFGVVDLGVGYTVAVDARMAGGHGRTDLAEMAQAAGVETLWAAPDPAPRPSSAPARSRSARPSPPWPRPSGSVTSPARSSPGSRTRPSPTCSAGSPSTSGPGGRSAPWPTPSGSPTPSGPTATRRPATTPGSPATGSPSTGSRQPGTSPATRPSGSSATP
jgi:hypothetical protein